ncbi:DNA-binding protein [Streptomyces sp. NBC_01750]|uniref:DNA-binding protein n=1 Tax=Streptomyces sp. NBC_01750 TaxID=2975928 RepID=UPI002DDB27FF|nr:DNA-binding protein [Streptomyces sp. NBC_01750]WSD30550.1 DNA-binding protein [Streptomyces sp. NBC_01750]
MGVVEVLLTTGQTAEELGCAITTFRRLVRADLLPDLSRRGVRVMVPLESVHALRDRPTAALEHLPAREIGVLRVDAARRVQEEDRQWIGFSTRLPPADLLKALRGWWRCDAPSVAAAGVLPVTLSGYVVAVLTGLEVWEKNAQGRYAFPHARLAGYVTDLATPVHHVTASSQADWMLADLLLGSRLVSHSGGTIAYVNTRTRS